MEQHFPQFLISSRPSQIVLGSILLLPILATTIYWPQAHKIAGDSQILTLAPSLFYLGITPRRAFSDFSLVYDDYRCQGHFEFHVVPCLRGNESHQPQEGYTFEARERAGPDAFEIRLAGPEAFALRADELHEVKPCFYRSDSFELFSRGVYLARVWHLYENFTAWKIMNPGTSDNPGYQIQYPPALPEYERLRGNQEVYLRPPTHTTAITCNRWNETWRKKIKSIFSNSSHELPNDSHSCAAGEHLPGRWVERRYLTKNSNVLISFESLNTSYLNRRDSIAFVPVVCELQRLESHNFLAKLHTGGVGRGARIRATGSRVRRILIAGDSHFRTLTNGFWFALSGTNDSTFHLPDIHVVKEGVSTYGNKIHVHYCPFHRPFADEVNACGPDLLQGPDDVFILGSGAWPLSAVRANKIMGPEEYESLIHDNILIAWDAWVQASPSRRVLWVSTIAQPMYSGRWLVEHSDHRNNFLNFLYNTIAKTVFEGSYIEYIDLFSLSLPVTHLSFDKAHYDSVVLRESVYILLTALLNEPDRI